jgi:tRNA A-37 threonylcarbamoyl transferase component Bud32
MTQFQALIGEKLGSYRIESVLGSGAMGVVYRATDEKRGRLAAVKVVHGEISQGNKVQQRFKREYEILNKFRHPAIVRNLAWGKFRGTWYIAMEFVQGLTLDTILQERGALPWREVVDLGIQVCDALQYAHSRGVVHRDLKPSNLMITADGKVKLTDFGIAKDLDKTALTATGRTLGTAAYMAPEQIRGTPAVSLKTDLYALGIVLYQMLVGNPPFEGTSAIVLMHLHINEPPRRPSDKVQEIPKALDELVVTLMAKEPVDRPFDALAVEHTLTELRDKAERGAAIAMVWPTPGSAAANPPRAGIPTGAGGARSDSSVTDRPKRKPRKAGPFSTLTGTLFATRSRSGTDESGTTLLSRGILEIAGLLLALVAVGGLIVYLVWPLSQEALYHKAEALMASKRPADRLTARDEYFELLERLPGNPYREQIQKWRDTILVDAAEGRAKYLTAAVETPFSKPNNRAESDFVVAHAVVASATKRHDDPTAVAEWKKLAAQLNPDDVEERGWYLLALKRAAEVENAISDNRLFIEKQSKIADEAFLNGHPEQARAIRDELIKQWKDHPYLEDLIRAIPTTAPPVPAPPSQPSDSTPPPKGGPPPSAQATTQPGDATQPAESPTPASELSKTRDSQPPKEVDQQSFSEFRS